MNVWTLLLWGLLASCASPHATRQQWENAEPLAEECDAPGEDRCILLLCGVGACGIYFCEDLSPGGIERAQASLPIRPPLAPPRPPPRHAVPTPDNPRRYWGSTLGLPQDAEPVFIIPWNQSSQEYAARLEQERANEGSDQRVWAKHHVFPQEFTVWFSRRGINIHEWTLVLEKHVHERIHQGARGGPWNAAWRQYIDENRFAGKQAVHLFAVQLIFRFALSGPIIPYHSKTVIPVFPLAEEDIY